MDYAHTHKRMLFSSIHRRGSKLTGKTETAPDNSSHEKGSLFRETHSLIEVIVRCLDLQTIAKPSGSVATECPSIITFFEQALDTISNVKSEMALQKQPTNSHLQSYGLTLLIPSLTALFNQVGVCENDGGCLLMKGTVLNHCNLIFQTLVEMATGAAPIFVGTYVKDTNTDFIPCPWGMHNFVVFLSLPCDILHSTYIFTYIHLHTYTLNE